MSIFPLASAVARVIPLALVLAAAPFAGAAQDASKTDAVQPQEAQVPTRAEPGGKRGISEEGGVKASGPSQAKGGESR